MPNEHTEPGPARARRRSYPDPVDAIVSLFRERGGDDYAIDCVTQEAHALQCARLAHETGRGDALVAAALLHDIGHMLHREPLTDTAPSRDLMHEAVGATWLARYFPEAVTEPVRLHVAAKRYLCTVDAGYLGLLSEASRHSLALQGGAMTAGERDAFEASPHRDDAVLLRRLDDRAKIPDLDVPALQTYVPLLRALAGER